MDPGLFSGVRFVYQPLIDLVSGSVLGYEALARPPEGVGDIDSFLFGIGSAGLTVDFDKYVLTRVSHLASRSVDFYDFPVHVNLSAVSFSSYSFYRWLIDFLPTISNERSLGIEITEHEPISRMEVCQASMDLFAAHGVSISLDDVYSGHMTLDVAKRLKGYDALKLDGGIVSQWADHGEVCCRSEALVSLAREREAAVVAECLDSPEKVRMAVSLGIAIGQGFLIGRPEIMPEAPLRIERRFLNSL